MNLVELKIALGMKNLPAANELMFYLRWFSCSEKFWLWVIVVNVAESGPISNSSLYKDIQFFDKLY